MPTQLFFVVVTSVIVLGVFNLLRSRRMREKYAFLWMLVGLAIIVLAALPSLLQVLAHALGFQLPSNFLFLLAIMLLLGVSLHLSLEVSRLEDETRVLAEDVAILNALVTQPGAPQDDESPQPPAAS